MERSTVSCWWQERKNTMIETERLILRPFREFMPFVNDVDGNPVYENTYQYAVLKREWEAK